MKTYYLVITLIASLSATLFGQNEHLKFKFSNVHFDRAEARMTADIEVYTSVKDLDLYAINARFFYEADFLEFESISDFKKGYDYVHDAPKPVIGGKESAVKMFGTNGTAGYVNAGIELKDVSAFNPEAKGKWSKLAQINFKLTKRALHSAEFCPILVWDRSIDEDKPSFLQGSVGAVATMIRKNFSGATECRNSSCSFENLNWILTSEDAPYGNMAATTGCLQNKISLAKSAELAQVTLGQNTPNPYTKETVVPFTIPSSQEITLKILDLKGQILFEKKETFNQGDNEFILIDLGLSAGTYLYQIETSDYVSDYMKMIKL